MVGTGTPITRAFRTARAPVHRRPVSSLRDFGLPTRLVTNSVGSEYLAAHPPLMLALHGEIAARCALGWRAGRRKQESLTFQFRESGSEARFQAVLHRGGDLFPNRATFLPVDNVKGRRVVVDERDYPMADLALAIARERVRIDAKILAHEPRSRRGSVFPGHPSSFRTHGVYESMSPQFFYLMIREIVQKLHLSKRISVVELGSGIGVAAAVLSIFFADVTGVEYESDLTKRGQEMVARLHQRFPEFSSRSRRLHLRRANFLRMDLSVYDLVVAYWPCNMKGLYEKLNDELSRGALVLQCSPRGLHFSPSSKHFNRELSVRGGALTAFRRK